MIPTHELRFGPFELNPAARELRKGPDPVHLTPKAFDLLTLLVERQPQALTKAELLEAIWPGTYISEHRLATLIAEIRLAIDAPGHASRVRTVHGFGYAFQSSAAPSATASSSGQFVLLHRRDTYLLSSGANIIGRDPGVAVYLDSPTASRRHARVDVGDGHVTVVDLGSKNGTFVGPSRVDATPQRLQEGDKLRIGSCVLTLALIGTAATETVAR